MWRVILYMQATFEEPLVYIQYLLQEQSELCEVRGEQYSYETDTSNVGFYCAI
jgi:hypothetical protein